jgi:hypothetical protein
MARSIVTNVTQGALTLPFPYARVIAPGKSAVVPASVDEVIELLGGVSAIDGVCKVGHAQDGEPGTISGVSVGYASLASDVIDGHKVSPAVDEEAHGSPHLVFIVKVLDVASADYDIVLDHAIEVFDVTVRKEGGAGGAANTVQVKSGANAITDVMSINTPDGSQIYPSTVDDANAEIASGGTLRVSVVKAGGNAACKVFISAVKRQ